MFTKHFELRTRDQKLRAQAHRSNRSRFKTNKRSLFFTKFVVNWCNSFPGDILDADLHGFKGKLEKYLEKRDFWTY